VKSSNRSTVANNLFMEKKQLLILIEKNALGGVLSVVL